jgi:ADP-heptose:LPS heptosyltransferase
MARGVEKILVIKLSALGDFVLALAAMKKIREAHKKAHVTLLTTPPFAALAKQSPYFNAVWTDGRPETFGQWTALRRKLRAAKFDRVYDLQTSAHSNRLFHLMRPNPPAWSGIAMGCSMPHRNSLRNSMHTLERQADQLMYAGIWPDAPTEPGTAPGPDLSWIWRGQPAERPVAGGVKPRPYVIFVPGGSAHRPEKRWPIDRFAALAVLAARHRVTPVVIGGAAERSLGAVIAERCAAARDLTGRTSLGDIVSLGQHALYAVGNDTGPMHLVVAAGCAATVLYSAASDPALTAPRGARVTILRRPVLAELALDEVAAMVPFG